MPQGLVPLAIPLSPVNPSGVQEQISLNATGSLAVIGNPGGPVVFAGYGSIIVPGLSGSFPRNVVGQRGTSVG
jgi:hypothetical protein